MADDKRHILGRAGEDAAESFLKKLGYKILDRNVRYAFGELDIVALDGAVLVLAEVKTRSSFSRDPADAVDFRKQRKLRRAAQAYMKGRDWLDRSARFDVLEVISPPGGAPRINHMKDAFE